MIVRSMILRSISQLETAYNIIFDENARFCGLSFQMWCCFLIKEAQVDDEATVFGEDQTLIPVSISYLETAHFRRNVSSANVWFGMRRAWLAAPKTILSLSRPCFCTVSTQNCCRIVAKLYDFFQKINQFSKNYFRKSHKII